MDSKESMKSMKLSAEDMETNRKKRDQLIQKYMRESRLINRQEQKK